MGLTIPIEAKEEEDRCGSVPAGPRPMGHTSKEYAKLDSTSYPRAQHQYTHIIDTFHHHIHTNIDDNTHNITSLNKSPRGQATTALTSRKRDDTADLAPAGARRTLDVERSDEDRHLGGEEGRSLLTKLQDETISERTLEMIIQRRVSSLTRPRETAEAASRPENLSASSFACEGKEDWESVLTTSPLCDTDWTTVSKQTTRDEVND